MVNRELGMTEGEGPVAGTPRSIGVMGGTFDPIHLGHLAVAEEAREALGLDRILFVPAGLPPHKPHGAVASTEDRVAMVRLAIAGNPAFALSRVDVDRPGPSYTTETMALVRHGVGTDDSAGSSAGSSKMRRLSPADGRRGCQPRNWFSGKFNSFINDSFQFCFDFLQAVTVTPGGCIR